MLELPLLLTFLACAFFAEVIGTMAGFGSATVLTPIASWFMAVKTAVAAVACFHLMGSASRSLFFRRQINWPIVWAFGLTGVACAFVGAQVAAQLPAAVVRMLLGAFLVLYVIAEMRRVTTQRVPATTRTLLVGGVVSGLVAGVIGTGGAVRSLCLLAFGLPKEEYLGTSAVIALAVDAARVPVYVAQHFLPATAWPVVLGLIVVAFCGAWTGQRLVRSVSPTAFKRFVLITLFVMGLKLLLDGWRGLP